MSFHLHACTKPLFTLSNSFVEDILWYASPCVNEALLQVAGVAPFPSQPNCASQDISGFPTHCFAPHSKSVIVCVCSSNGSWCQNESGVAWCRISDRKFSCVVASRKSLMFFFKSLFVILAALSNLCSQKRYEAVKFQKKKISTRKVSNSAPIFTFSAHRHDLTLKEKFVRTISNFGNLADAVTRPYQWNLAFGSRPRVPSPHRIS